MKPGASIESRWPPLQGSFQDLEVLAVRRVALLGAEYERSSRRGINENL